MLDTILTILLIFFGAITSIIFVLPLMIGIFDSSSHYLPFGIGTAIGVVISFILSYALKFHT